MKRCLMALLLVAGLAPASYAVAGEEPKSIQFFQQEIELTIASLETQRKVLIEHNLQLSDEEAAAFWPVYNDYRARMRKVTDELVRIITDYADAWRHHSLSDKQAIKLVDRYLNVLQNRIKVKKSFVHKFKKALPPKKVARFYQVDHRLDMLVDMAIAKGVPLAE